MNHEFENIGKKLPYDLPSGSLEALQKRIRSHTTAQPEPAALRSARSVYLTAAATAAATVVIAGVLITEYYNHKTCIPAPDLEQILATTPTETLQQAAAENYDDIFYNQQL